MRRSVLARFRPATLSVISDVKAAPFELQSRHGNQAFHFPTAFIVSSDGLVGELLHHFESVAALLTFVLVKRHRNLMLGLLRSLFNDGMSLSRNDRPVRFVCQLSNRRLPGH